MVTLERKLFPPDLAVFIQKVLLEIESFIAEALLVY